ncbi:hypothetical protein PIB30_042343 [Stylosanthes scabra]|uniref:Uncharacterized protein n=1 Tax=Stylosanthes scabra TaxID=79078 RepID=A0ABU6SFX9_9FABA|nr:hypothetical protein [Stylosanthes scabra]
MGGSAKVKAEGGLKSLSGRLEALGRERDQEVERRKDREAEFGRDIQDLRKLVSDEKAHADKAEASLAESEKVHEELVWMAEDSIIATERALKDQVSLLLLSLMSPNLELLRIRRAFDWGGSFGFRLVELIPSCRPFLNFLDACSKSRFGHFKLGLYFDSLKNRVL